MDTIHKSCPLQAIDNRHAYPLVLDHLQFRDTVIHLARDIGTALETTIQKELHHAHDKKILTHEKFFGFNRDLPTKFINTILLLDPILSIDGNSETTFIFLNSVKTTFKIYFCITMIS